MEETPETLAKTWIRGLQERGVSVSLKNNRVDLQPKSAYRELSDDEFLTFRHHRQAIKDAIRAGTTTEVTHAPNIDVEPTPAHIEPEQPKCRWCNQSPCIGPEHQYFETLHFLDPIETARRQQLANEEMLTMLRRAIIRTY